jgi:hypothetical protein
MAYPPQIQAILDGGPADPGLFEFGSGPPTPSTFPVGTFYVDVETQDVYWNATGNAFSNVFSEQFLQTTSQEAQWTKVHSGIVHAVQPGMTINQDISFIAGDSVHNLSFFFPGICYTMERPTDSTGEPIADPDPTHPFKTNTLPVPWQQRVWFSEIRNTYVSTIRYHNGWVPWYGTWPNWVWWEKYSLVGAFYCTSEWDPDRLGTMVTLNLDASMSNMIRPAKTYRWDLESAHPVPPVPPAETVSVFDLINTWVRGNCAVLDQYTMTPV